MHFGRFKDQAALATRDLSLPDDTARTIKFLSLKQSEQTRIYIGCPIWAARQWLGTLYPRGTKSADFLKIYATKFNTVEVNSTFYHLLGDERIDGWRDQVPDGFKFCPKVYRGITEALGEATMPRLLADFCASIRRFEGTLGLVFAQLPETFAPHHAGLLVRFLEQWPQDLPLAVELRHRDWFGQHALRDDVVNLFYRRGVATVITDTVGRRDALHLSLTQPRVLIRFLGNEHATDEVRLADWSRRLEVWQGKNIDEVYFFTHQPDDLPIAETAGRMVEMMQGVSQQVVGIRA